MVIPAPFLFALNKPTGRKTGKGLNMENVQNQNITTRQEGTQQAAGAVQQLAQEQQGKLFTQDDVDRIVGNRLARMKQELETSGTYRRERDEARQELERYKNEAFLKEQGVTETYLDYVAFRAMQRVDENNSFQQAATKFLKENPTFAGKGFRVVSTGINGNSNGSWNGRASDSDIRKAMGLK